MEPAPDPPPLHLARRGTAALVDLALVIAGVAAWSDILAGGVSRAWGGAITVVATAIFCLLCEALFAGRTPGKALVGLRVVDAGGDVPDLRACVLRNLARPVDLVPVLPPYGIALVVTVATRGRRVGDLLAGTRVERSR